MKKLPYHLRTKRLLLEQFSKKHLTQTYVDWLNDPEVVRFSRQRHLKHTLESCRKYIYSYRETQNCIWAICVDGLHIGNITAQVDTDTADVAILIGEKEFWGKGYGTEAFVAMRNHLIDLDIRKVTAGALATNIRMLKVMKKAGMVEYGREHYIWEDRRVDMIYMALKMNNLCVKR